MRGVPRLVLASASPRRRELLEMLALDFVGRPADLDETRRRGEAAEAYVSRLARAKAAHRVAAGECVLAADTSVVLGEEILGKPRDRAEAETMVGRLAGRTHRVLTAVAVAHQPAPGRGGVAPERQAADEVATTEVTFCTMTRREISWYAGTGEGLDKAGAYAVQGIGALFVERLVGNYTNVVGLPLPVLARCLRRIGLDLLTWRHPAVAVGAER